MSRLLAVRVVLALLALAGAAWCFASLESARLDQQIRDDITARARQTGNYGLLGADLKDPAFRAKLIHLAERARSWAPGQANTLYEVNLLSISGRRPRALALLNGLIAREPRNPAYWQTLAILVAKTNPSLSRRAYRRLVELTPPPPK